MKRDELFTTGTYASLTLRVMARPDLTPAAKLVWQALASHLRNGDEWVWPSLDRLADLCGCSRATAARSTMRLRDLGLLETRPNGRGIAYRLLAPPVAKCDQSQNETPPVSK